MAPGTDASCPRVPSAAAWSGRAVGCALARFGLDHLVPDGPVDLVGDDTVPGHPGAKVYGKGRHRDAVRSPHAYTAWRYGHKWVAPAVLVRFPFAARRWAPPALADLYRPPEVGKAEGARPRTPAPLKCRLLRVVRIRFPDRPFVFAGDPGCGAHAVARFCHRHRRRLALVSTCHPDVNLFAPPPPRTGKGRPRVTGRRLPKPRAAAATARRRTPTVAGYGGGTRRVGAATGTGRGSTGGHGRVPIRWVLVQDTTGTRRGEYLFATDTGRTADAVVGTYGGRWSIETTFQECRSCIGSETTRGRCRRAVCRAAPCLFGLYSVVAILYHLLPESGRAGGAAWPGTEAVTFAGALPAVRRRVWGDGVFPQAKVDGAIAELPESVRDLRPSGLAPAP